MDALNQFISLFKSPSAFFHYVSILHFFFNPPTSVASASLMLMLHICNRIESKVRTHTIKAELHVFSVSTYMNLFN